MGSSDAAKPQPVRCCSPCTSVTLIIVGFFAARLYLGPTTGGTGTDDIVPMNQLEFLRDTAEELRLVRQESALKAQRQAHSDQWAELRKTRAELDARREKLNEGTVKANFAYEANQADELSFHRGDRIRLLATPQADGWAHGELVATVASRTTKSGLFPVNFVDAAELQQAVAALPAVILRPATVLLPADMPPATTAAVGGRSEVMHYTEEKEPCFDDGGGSCAKWAAAGECGRNPVFMRSNCRLSCGLCASSSVHRLRGAVKKQEKHVQQINEAQRVFLESSGGIAEVAATMEQALIERQKNLQSLNAASLENSSLNLTADEEKSLSDVVVVGSVQPGRTGPAPPPDLRAKHLPATTPRGGGDFVPIVIPPPVRRSDIPHECKNVSHNIHAFYYPWYGNPDQDGQWAHWNHMTIPHWDPAIASRYPPKRHVPPADIAAAFYPKLGPYSSTDPEIIAAHMRMLCHGGIGVIVVAWYPPGRSDSNGGTKQQEEGPFSFDSLMSPLLDAAHAHDIRIAVHIEPYEGRTAESTLRDVRYITARYGKHPALARAPRPLINTPERRGIARKRTLPLMYVYDSYRIPSSEWALALRQLWGTPSDAVLLGLVCERDQMETNLAGGFDGMYTYFAADGFTWASTKQSSWQAMKSFADRNDMLFVPSIGPGYTDTTIRPWNGENTRARHGGRYFANAIKFVKNLRVSMVSITSFNEWHEGTQIEPAVSPPPGASAGYLTYADGPNAYLDTTRVLAHSLEFRDRPA